MSEIARLLNRDQAWDVMCAFHGVRIPENTLHSCARAASQLASCNGPLVIIETVEAPMRRCYSDYPETGDWLKLERTGFIANGDYFGMIIDALH
jgi:hypothetical protein